MKNKTVLITGGNAGIGKETAVALSAMGAQVVIVSRNAEKGKLALKEIRKRSGSEKADLLTANLASLREVRQLAAEFTNKYENLDVLLNNAGCILTDHTLTKDGFEMQFGVNHLAHFLLTHLLLDRLEAAPDSRVVNVSSKSHYGGGLDFDSLTGMQNSYDGMKAYSQSKLCNVLFTREFVRRYPEKGITANALHPGVVKTQIGNKSSWLWSLAWTIMKPFMLSQERGAKTSVYLASSPEVKGVTGKFFDEHQKEKRPSDLGQNDQLAEKLWNYSLEKCNLT